MPTLTKSKRVPITASYKGRTFAAVLVDVERVETTSGKSLGLPSHAAAHFTKGQSINGWKWWKFVDPTDGQEKFIDTLRGSASGAGTRTAQTPAKAPRGETRAKAVSAIVRAFVRLTSPKLRELAERLVDGKESRGQLDAFLGEFRRVAKLVPSPVADVRRLPGELLRATRGFLSEADTKYVLALKAGHASIAQVAMEMAVNHVALYHLYKSRGLVTPRGAKQPAAKKVAKGKGPAVRDEWED